MDKQKRIIKLTRKLDQLQSEASAIEEELVSLAADAMTAKEAFYYAREVVKGRWPEAEKVIAADPKWAFYYASEVIKERWPEAEAIITSDPDWLNYYANHFDLTIETTLKPGKDS